MCCRHLALSEEDAELSHIADIAQVLKQVYNTLANTASMYRFRLVHDTGLWLVISDDLE